MSSENKQQSLCPAISPSTQGDSSDGTILSSENIVSIMHSYAINPASCVIKQEPSEPDTMHPPEIPYIPPPQSATQAAPPPITEEFVPNASTDSFVSISALAENVLDSVSSPEVIERRKARPQQMCNCKLSRCVQLFCECFANGKFCKNCTCKGCANNLSHKKKWSNAIKLRLKRHPMAFRPRKLSVKGIEENDAQNDMGCNCRQSKCVENGCKCYEAKNTCSTFCKCVWCKNFEKNCQRKRLMHFVEKQERERLMRLRLKKRSKPKPQPQGTLFDMFDVPEKQQVIGGTEMPTTEQQQVREGTEMPTTEQQHITEGTEMPTTEQQQVIDGTEMPTTEQQQVIEGTEPSFRLSEVPTTPSTTVTNERYRTNPDRLSVKLMKSCTTVAPVLTNQNLSTKILTSSSKQQQLLTDCNADVKDFAEKLFQLPAKDLATESHDSEVTVSADEGENANDAMCRPSIFKNTLPSQTPTNTKRNLEKNAKRKTPLHPEYITVKDRFSGSSWECKFFPFENFSRFSLLVPNIMENKLIRKVVKRVRERAMKSQKQEHSQTVPLKKKKVTTEKQEIGSSTCSKPERIKKLNKFLFNQDLVSSLPGFIPMKQLTKEAKRLYTCSSADTLQDQKTKEKLCKLQQEILPFRSLSLTHKTMTALLESSVPRQCSSLDCYVSQKVVPKTPFYRQFDGVMKLPSGSFLLHKRQLAPWNRHVSVSRPCQKKNDLFINRKKSKHGGAKHKESNRLKLNALNFIHKKKRKGTYPTLDKANAYQFAHRENLVSFVGRVRKVNRFYEDSEGKGEGKVRLQTNSKEKVSLPKQTGIEYRKEKVSQPKQTGIEYRKEKVSQPKQTGIEYKKEKDSLPKQTGIEYPGAQPVYVSKNIQTQLMSLLKMHKAETQQRFEHTAGGSAEEDNILSGKDLPLSSLVRSIRLYQQKSIESADLSRVLSFLNKELDATQFMQISIRDKILLLPAKNNTLQEKAVVLSFDSKANSTSVVEPDFNFEGFSLNSDPMYQYVEPPEDSHTITHHEGMDSNMYGVSSNSHTAPFLGSLHQEESPACGVEIDIDTSDIKMETPLMEPGEASDFDFFPTESTDIRIKTEPVDFSYENHDLPWENPLMPVDHNDTMHLPVEMKSEEGISVRHEEEDTVPMNVPVTSELVIQPLAARQDLWMPPVAGEEERDHSIGQVQEGGPGKLCFNNNMEEEKFVPVRNEMGLVHMDTNSELSKHSLDETDRESSNKIKLQPKGDNLVIQWTNGTETNGHDVWEEVVVKKEPMETSETVAEVQE